MNRSRKNSSPISRPDVFEVPRGTPLGQGKRYQYAANLRDRLQVIYGDADPWYVLRFACGARTYRELIRRYSNASML